MVIIREYSGATEQHTNEHSSADMASKASRLRAHPAHGLKEAEEDGGIEAVAERAGANAPEEWGHAATLRHHARRSACERRPAAGRAHHHRLHHVQGSRRGRSRSSRRPAYQQILHDRRLQGKAIACIRTFIMGMDPGIVV